MAKISLFSALLLLAACTATPEPSRISACQNTPGCTNPYSGNNGIIWTPQR